jgi:hypothetical protein
MRQLLEDGRRVCLRLCARETATTDCTAAIATDKLDGVWIAGPAVFSFVFDGFVSFVSVRDGSGLDV